MTLPVRHRRGSLPERSFPARGRGEPAAAGFDNLFDRMSRLLETAATTPGATTPGTSVWAPAAEMRETDDAYVIEADLPGIERDAIDIEITERELRITGERKERAREGVLRRSTRRTGRFAYRVLLPADVKADEIGAALGEGVLTVTAPKARAAAPRHIPIAES